MAELYKDIYSYDLRATDRCSRIFSIVKYKLLTRFIKEHPVSFLDVMCIKEVETSDEIHENYLYKIEQFVVDNEYTFEDMPEKEQVYKALSHVKPLFREPLLLRAGGFTHQQILGILYREGKLKSNNIHSLKSQLFYGRKKWKLWSPTVVTLYTIHMRWLSDPARHIHKLNNN
ncbi:MAG: hypothetical protein LIP04_08495 [Tannerellaceae bacterium]|nr:hypothetical protein [Tannerellaceae bacterium]